MMIAVYATQRHKGAALQRAMCGAMFAGHPVYRRVGSLTGRETIDRPRMIRQKWPCGKWEPIAVHANDPRVAVAAATQILDRAYGRPPQTIDANINEDRSVRFYAEVPRLASTTEEWVAGNPPQKPTH